MASLIRFVGGLSKCFYQGLWLADLNVDVIGQSMNRRGVAQEFPFDSFFFLFCTIFVWVFIQIPEGMDGPM